MTKLRDFCRKRALAELRSGKYKQIHGNYSNGCGFCAVGVMVKAQLPDTYVGDLRFKDIMNQIRSLELDDGLLAKLFRMNDNDMLSFNQIADILEKEWFPDGQVHVVS